MDVMEMESGDLRAMKGCAEIKEPFFQTLRDAQFVKKGSDTWYYPGQDVWLVANLQKSQYGCQYYINIAMWLTPLEKPTWPKEHQCHIRIRATDLGSEADWDFKRLLSAEDLSLPSSERRERMRSLMQNLVIPFLMSCRDISGVRSAYETGKFRGCFVGKGVAEVLRGK